MISSRSRVLVGVLVALCLGASAGANAADAVRGKKLGYTCLGCHGIPNYKNVYPTYNVPKLVGQRPEYIAAALKAYRSGERSHGTMHAQAASLNDAAIDDIAAYLAGDAITKGGATADNAPAKVKELCVACHGTDGVGITPDYPNLVGQHEDYLAQALLEYKKGGRKNAVMGTFVTTLSEADIEEIAAWYAHQQPGLQTVYRRISSLSAAR